MSEKQYFMCPFCKELDFDLIGLKSHYLKGWCDVFEETPAPWSEFGLSEASTSEDQ